MKNNSNNFKKIYPTLGEQVLEGEIFKPVPDYPNYVVSNYGRIWTHARNKFLKGMTDAGGYWKIELCRNNTQKTMHIHKLVMLVFVGQREKGMYIRHLDGNRNNNRLDNLQYGTAIENGRDKIEHGTAANGERSGCALISNKDAVYIFYHINMIDDVKEKIKLKKKFSLVFGISMQYIGEIISERKWSEITKNITDYEEYLKDYILPNEPISRKTYLDEILPNEKFNQIINYPNYLISNMGRVVSLHTNKIMKPHGDYDQYQMVGLSKDGKSSKFLVHSLVAEAFIGPREHGYQIRHINGIKSDNRLENLAYGTQKDNERDKIANGKYQYGGNNPAAKLTFDDVADIRIRLEKGENNRHIAEIYGVIEKTIRRIKNGETWYKE